MGEGEDAVQVEATGDRAGASCARGGRALSALNKVVQDGTDATGARAASGVYYVQLSVNGPGGDVARQKLVLLR